MSLEPIIKTTPEIESPCVCNCCLDEQDICLGCFRHIDEIVSWRKLNNTEKNTVIQQCHKRAQQRAK